MDHTGLPHVTGRTHFAITALGETYGLEPDVLEKLKVETSYRRLEAPPSVTSHAMILEIGSRKINCPFCDWETTEGNYRREIPLVYEGVTTGLRVVRNHICKCWAYERFVGRWSGKKSMVPVGYRQFRLGALEPSDRSILDPSMQARIIFELQENPFRSYLFSGPAGTGKTVWSTALFSKALYDWAIHTWDRDITTEAVWRVNVADYFQQEHDYMWQTQRVSTNMGDERLEPAKEPVVNKRKIRAARKAGLVPRIFLEEIDKTPRLTPQRSSDLFGLINECYEQEGQIVVNTNKTSAQLIEHLGSDNGEAIVRRITRERDEHPGKYYDLYSLAKFSLEA